MRCAQNEALVNEGKKMSEYECLLQQVGSRVVRFWMHEKSVKILKVRPFKA